MPLAVGKLSLGTARTTGALFFLCGLFDLGGGSNLDTESCGHFGVNLHQDLVFATLF
jgi:hypothetical protein